MVNRSELFPLALGLIPELMPAPTERHGARGSTELVASLGHRMESGTSLFGAVLLDLLVLARATAGDSLEPRDVVDAVLDR